MWSEKLLASVFASSSAPILVVEQKDRTIRDCNAAAEALFGWPRADLIGNSTSLLAAVPDEWVIVAREARRLFALGKVPDLRIRGCHRSGRVLPLRIRGQAFDHEGQRYNSLICEDLTDIEAAHDELREEARLARERVKELRCIYDVSAELAEIERPLTERLAALPGHIRQGWQFSDNAHAEIAMGDRRYATPGYTQGVARQSREIRVAGETVGTVTVAYDKAFPQADEGPFVREERQLIDAIALRIGSAIGRHRTDEALRRAQKLQTIGQLAGGVAHDFNNLLAVLAMQLEMVVEEETLPAATRRRLAVAHSVVDKGAALTRQLLSFARQQVLKPGRIDGSALVRDMSPFLTRTLGTNIGVAVEAKEAGAGVADLWINADRGLLESAILNLCINARDALPSGGDIRISVAARTVGDDEAASLNARPGDYVEFAVADNGIGMPPEVLERVFEPFFTTKAVGTGTGLGLSMVHGFVTQSGGFAAIDSTVGKGTTVRLALPRDRSGAPVAARRVEASAAGRERILVVDDNRALRRPLVQNLARLGYSVAEAQGGVEALQQIGLSPPDLIVTDMMMPGMPGPEFVRRVRDLHPALPVVVVSGHGLDASDALLSLPRIAYCPKPFTTRELGARMRELLDAALLERGPPARS